MGVQDVVRRFDSLHVVQMADDVVHTPLSLRIACTISRLLPRAKGASARLIGRLFLSDRYFSVMTSKGFRLVSTSDAMDMLVSLNNSGGWDDHVLNKCLQLIQRDHVFYDIGANLGYIAVGVACLGSAGTRLFAFEPLEGLAGAIARSAALNGLDRLTIYRAALDRETGRQNFFVPAHTIHASFVSRARATRRIDVATFALDELIADGALPAPHLVKIDVEGAEMRVIDGAAHTLATHRPAIVYECDENSRRFGHTPKTIIGKLRELGYCRFARINPATGDEQDASGAGDDDYGDFVALAK